MGYVSLPEGTHQSGVVGFSKETTKTPRVVSVTWPLP